MKVFFHANKSGLFHQLMGIISKGNVHSSLQRPNSELSLAQQVPGDVLLKLVAERAHNKDWNLLGNKLNVATEEIEQIEMNNLDDPVAKVTISLSRFFRKWQTHM